MAPQIISPFDPAASIRLQRMGLLTADGQINTSAVEAVSVMQAGLLYTQILDACGDWDSTRNVCRRITSQAAQVTDRQILLIISIQYDTIAKPLPEVIWWISGSDALLAPFVRGSSRRFLLCVCYTFVIPINKKNNRFSLVRRRSPIVHQFCRQIGADSALQSETFPRFFSALTCHAALLRMRLFDVFKGFVYLFCLPLPK